MIATPLRNPPEKHQFGRLLRHLSGIHRRRVLRDFRRRAEWAAEARNAPTTYARMTNWGR
jgi:hypothetical protein